MAEIDKNGMAERTRSHQKRLVFLRIQSPSLFHRKRTVVITKTKLNGYIVLYKKLYL
jgi:hypothetical protein